MISAEGRAKVCREKCRVWNNILYENEELMRKNKAEKNRKTEKEYKKKRFFAMDDDLSHIHI